MPIYHLYLWEINVFLALVFRILDIKQHEVLQEANYLSPSIPTQLQLMDDCSYCVTDNCQKPGELYCITQMMDDCIMFIS